MICLQQSHPPMLYLLLADNNASHHCECLLKYVADKRYKDQLESIQFSIQLTLAKSV